MYGEPSQRGIIIFLSVTLFGTFFIGAVLTGAAVPSDLTDRSNNLEDVKISQDSSNETAEPTLETLRVDQVDTMGPELRGEITDLGGLNETRVWFEHRQTGITDWKVTSISADGGRHSDPARFGHGGNYIHVNDPIGPGEVREFTYYGTNPNDDMRPHLRDSPYTADGNIDDIWRGNRREVFPSDERVTVRVQRVGDEVRIYVDGEQRWTATGITQNTIYFSSYEDQGDFDLLLESDRLESPGEFTQSAVMGADFAPNTEYEFRAVTEDGADEFLTFKTGQPVEIIGASSLDTNDSTLIGEVALGSLHEVEVWFEYRKDNLATWEETDRETVTESGTFEIAEQLEPETEYEVRAVAGDVTSDVITVNVTGSKHPSGVQTIVWEVVTDQNQPANELTFQDLVEAVQAYQNDETIRGIELTFQDLVNLIQWYQD